jgi:hypothetical protein
MKSETRLAEFGMIDRYNHELSTKDQLCYQHEYSNDVAYWEILVDAAEQFFNRMIKELEQVSIDRIIDTINSRSTSSPLAKKSILGSNAVLPIQAHKNENE